MQRYGYAQNTETFDSLLSFLSIRVSRRFCQIFFLPNPSRLRTG
ncbi:hypothetical protein CSUI_008352, partial [Cystoisospora suis]